MNPTAKTYMSPDNPSRSNNQGKFGGRVFLCAALCLIAIFAICVTGCTSASTDNTTSANASSSEASSADSSSSIDENIPAEVTQAVDELRIGSLKGPTSIGLAYMMSEQQGQFTIAATADEIAPKLLQDELDIALVPANLAATLYQKSNGGIQVIDINTLGVLFAVSAADVASMDDLRGKTVYMTGKGTVPEYTVLALLQASGIPAEEVDIQFRSEPAEVVALISQDHEAVGILPQPYATSAVIKDTSLHECIDLTSAWEESTEGEHGDIVTGVTIAKAQTVADKPEVIAEFLRRHAISAEVTEVESDSIVSEVVSLGIIDSEAIAQTAIPKCNVVFIAGDEMKRSLSGYLKALYEQNPESVGGQLPEDGFYYTPDTSDASANA